jgi:hypothetical protein
MHCMVAHFDIKLHEIDVKTALLNGDLEDEVYMTQHACFGYKNQKICKLSKSNQWAKIGFSLVVYKILHGYYLI